MNYGNVGYEDNFWGRLPDDYYEGEECKYSNREWQEEMRAECQHAEELDNLMLYR